MKKTNTKSREDWKTSKNTTLFPMFMGQIALCLASCVSSSRLESMELRITSIELKNNEIREVLMSEMGISVDDVLAKREKERKLYDIPRDGSWAIGVDGAAITIVDFSDLECPYSAQAAKSVQNILRQHGDKVRIIFKHFPLSMHKRSRMAHAALMAAGRQGYFWEYRFGICGYYDDLSDNNLEKLAESLNMNMERFKADMAIGPDDIERLDRDIALGRSIGVEGTPRFFVNGFMTTNPEKVVDALLKGENVKDFEAVDDFGCMEK
jgi:protein-disulfide isomerase